MMVHRLPALALAVLLAALAACGGGAPPPQVPRSLSELASPLGAALREESVGDPARAVDGYVRALSLAGSAPDAPASTLIAMAALEALVHHELPALSMATTSSALESRVPPAALGGSIDDLLAKAAADARGPFVPPLIARARLALAERRGDASAAKELRARAGCVREASVVGPVAWANVTGPSEPALLDAAVMPSEVSGPGPFMPRRRPMKVTAFGCRLPLYAETSARGVREVAVDVEVPKSGTLGLGLRSSSAAVLRAGGETVIERPHALGSSAAQRFARVEASAGTLRLVVRVGMGEDYGAIELGAWDEAGAPLVARAPAPGSAAGAKVSRVVAVTAPDPRTDPERVAVALGALAANDPHAAEGLLSPQVARRDAPPDLLLVYARAVRRVRDLPDVKRNERASAAYERVREAWPTSWEAALEHAALAGARRGHAEARIQTLAALDELRAKSAGGAGDAFASMLDAFEAQVAGLERLHDRARAAFERARAPLAGTALLAHTERAVFTRAGRELASFECSAEAGDRSTLRCHHALAAIGDRVAAERELERLRALADTPQLYLTLSTRAALEAGETARARGLLDAMNPGDRTLSGAYAAKTAVSAADLLRLAPAARDAPSALPPLLRDAGDDPLAELDGLAEEAVADETAAPLLANAATAILARHERYDIEPSGLVRFRLFDVRRVMGTTDVDANAQAAAPMLFGQGTLRILRRRIFKKDGRVVLPDPTPHAAQSHADLSQLEPGDAVEAVYEGFALPDDGGNVGLDTPDLMPERTAVHRATIELRYPEGLPSSLWSHPLLGAPTDRVEAGKRVLTWRVEDRSVRRLEASVPKMDRDVGVSFSTATWSDVARGLREAIASLEADSPEVTTWAREAAAGLRPSRELVEKITLASGAAIREAFGTALTDTDLGDDGTTARTALATREGSRTWLIVQALRTLGVRAEVVVAENEPFSASPSFPPHVGRFMHPLAVATVPDPSAPSGTAVIWIDADVPGPPLPAGRISPELRGRGALHPDGRITPLPAAFGDAERDEVDIRLAVDDEGNARGTITVLLRGRAAQDLADALVRLVGLERQNALRGIALGWVPFATVETVDLSSTEGSWQVAIRAELSAPAYAKVEGTTPGGRSWVLPGMDPIHYVYPRPFVTTLSSTYATQAARDSALAVNHATQYHVRRRVELPDGARIELLPGPFEGKGPLVEATRRIAVSGATIEEDFTLEVSTGTVPREEYGAFVAVTHRADDAFRASTRVRPPPP